MAVYTEVSFDVARALVQRLRLGTLLALDPVHGGIENTNYFVDTDRGRYVLTLFERMTREELPFYLRLMQHLAQRGLPVPEPHADAGGEILHVVAGKPAALVDRLRGSHPLAPDAAHCAAVGAVLARLHLAAQDFALQQPNPRGLDWWIATAAQVAPQLAPEQRALLDAELEHARRLAGSEAHRSLPRGPIHADLFRDNVMFEGDRLSGLFDFYFAGIDTWAYDIAVCLNDWCIDLASGRLDETRAEAFVAAYHAQRPLSGQERRLMPALMRSAALRFWLSRLDDLYRPRDARLLKPHDPGHFERVLRARAESPWHPELAAG
jgi:homoserine kinase type II